MNTAYIIKHHDEGICTERHKYNSEGYRIVKETTTEQDLAKFLSTQHCSGFSRALVPQKDIVRYINNYHLTESVVFTIPVSIFNNNLRDLLIQSEIVDTIEVIQESSVKVINV